MSEKKLSLFQSLEQIVCLLRDLAPVLKGYKKNLTDQGFSEAEAMQIVIAYQHSLVTGGKKDG